MLSQGQAFPLLLVSSLGISSSILVSYKSAAGIPDFRGPEGAWTLRAQGKQSKAANTLTAIPTPTHMALVELQNRGILKYLVSQNCDGLHRRSGILPVCLPHLFLFTKSWTLTVA